MACSKIFSGDLPELINEIIHYFQNDYKTLYSCILVNRIFCRFAIPLLWKDPFSSTSKNHYLVVENYNKRCDFIHIYLYNLNEDDKKKLKEYGIDNKLFPSNTLFNYSSFIKRLNTYKILHSIEKWIVRAITIEKRPTNYFMHNTNLLPFSNSDQYCNIKRLIYKSLLKNFIENKVNLHTFEISMIADKDFHYFNDSFELILQNPNFTHNIKNLELNYGTEIVNINPFLKFLYSNCKEISSLYFLFSTFIDDNILVDKHLSQIINSQQNLEKILFGFNNFPLYHSLLSLKNSNCSNTLNIIIFYYVDFKNVVILKEVFEGLNVLESIHILYCYSLDSNFIQQIVNLSKPFKLKSLFIEKIYQIESLQSLLQKSGDYLENFGFTSLVSEPNQQILELIKKYCTTIKFLDLPGFNRQNINLAFDLIGNFKQSLNYLTISIGVNRFFSYDYDDNVLSSNVLLNLGQILPSRLEYLSLTLMINANEFEVFLKYSQNTFIRKLLVKNKIYEECENILPYIKKYIMKNKRVEYLAVVGAFLKEDEDLFSLKDEVKEFASYNIKVLNYYELKIDYYNFIKELD
ncbi:hypothetical protein RclHR1_08750010 [Rhizophagus clarus]|uniref:F-box domain-containing protein n=1 Tax=Rhizophagus clarus TaxID=94130 RepID=A0A2Z6S4B6_9GLOM|nr:hypothetical protein RclHR1_08750010 [Rhizophagus clarus]GES79381.1 hypothetical protein GLOIN_2v1877448 [Rhizophagus clarus]